MDTIQLIKNRLIDINDTLPDALPDAKVNAIKALAQLNATRDEYSKLYAENFTCALRQILKTTHIPGWKIVDGPNCLHLQDADTLLKVRFLKEFAFVGPIPPAGRNPSRMDAWCQGSLDWDATITKTPHPLRDIELILVWTEYGDQFQCTAYQPLSTGKFPRGASGRAIMKMPIGISHPDFESIQFGSSVFANELVPKANTIVTAEQRILEKK